MRFAIALTALAVCLPCFAQEEDMCQSHVGMVPCREDTPITHACFDDSDPVNCLDCILVLAELGVIPSDYDNVVNTIAGCLTQAFPAATWQELEDRKGGFTDSIGVTYSAAETHQFLIDGVYIARLGASNLKCRRTEQEVPSALAGEIRTWNRDADRDPAPVTARMADKAFSEQPEAQAVVIFSECSAVHSRAGPHLYFRPADRSELGYHDAVFAILAQENYTAVAVPRNSLEAEVFAYAGWKARPVKKENDQFVVFLPPLREYHFL